MIYSKKIGLFIFLFFLWLCSCYNNFSYAENEKETGVIQVSYILGQVEDITSQITLDDSVNNIKHTKTRLKVKILEGKDQGKTVEISTGINQEDGNESSLVPKAGNKLLLTVKQGDKTEYEISDYYRMDGIYWQLAIFFLIILLISKAEGFKFITFTVFASLLIIYLLFPVIALGLNYLSKILVYLIASVLAGIFVIVRCKGLNKKTFSSLSGLLLSYIIVFILSSIFENITCLTGNFKSQDIISIVILTGVSGAIAFLSYMTASRINEFKKAQPTASGKKLFDIGMKVAKNEGIIIVGIILFVYIANILAVFSSLAQQHVNFLQLFNTELVATELTRMFTSCTGLLLAVPITSFIGARIYK